MLRFYVVVIKTRFTIRQTRCKSCLCWVVAAGPWTPCWGTHRFFPLYNRTNVLHETVGSWVMCMKYTCLRTWRDEGSKYDSRRPSSPHTVRQGNTESTVSVGHQETETNIKSIKCIFFRLKQSIPFSKQVRGPSYNHFIFPIRIISGGRKSNS